MSYVSPIIQDKFETLSVDLKNTILSRNVDLHNMSDLIHVLEEIVAGDENQSAQSLPMRAMDDIPDPKPDAAQITGLVKESGKVTGYQLSNGSIVNKEEGVTMARHGDIKGVGVAHRDGNEYLKSLPDGTENNNLSNLPSISI